MASSYLAISEDIKKELYFPNLLFSNIKYIEKQLNYGPRFQEYYWMNTLENIPYDFEYYETLKITSYCHFDYSTFPFDHHKCELNLGVTDRSINVLKLSKPILIFEGMKSKNDTIFINSSNIPYDVKIESISPFNVLTNNYNFSYIGIQLVFHRNSLGQCFLT